MHAIARDGRYLNKRTTTYSQRGSEQVVVLEPTGYKHHHLIPHLIPFGHQP